MAYVALGSFFLCLCLKKDGGREKIEKKKRERKSIEKDTRKIEIKIASWGGGGRYCWS